MCSPVHNDIGLGFHRHVACCYSQVIINLGRLSDNCWQPLNPRRHLSEHLKEDIGINTPVSLLSMKLDTMTVKMTMTMMAMTITMTMP